MSREFKSVFKKMVESGLDFSRYTCKEASEILHVNQVTLTSTARNHGIIFKTSRKLRPYMTINGQLVQTKKTIDTSVYNKSKEFDYLAIGTTTILFKTEDCEYKTQCPYGMTHANERGKQVCNKVGSYHCQYCNFCKTIKNKVCYCTNNQKGE